MALQSLKAKKIYCINSVYQFLSIVILVPNFETVDFIIQLFNEHLYYNVG